MSDAPHTVGTTGPIEKGVIKTPFLHIDDVRLIVTIILFVLVVGGTIWHIVLAQSHQFIKDSCDLNGLFDAPIAGMLGALTAVIGFYFADKRR